jgi:CRP-like cAMP-binding protein
MSEAASGRLKFYEEMLHTDLFRDLTVKTMEDLMLFAQSRHYSAGETVIQENEIGEKFYWVQNGTLEVQLFHMSNAENIVLHVLKTGDLFGETALLGIERRMASVTSKDGAFVFSWNAAGCLNYFKKNKEVGFQVMQNLAYILGTRIRDMNMLIRNVADTVGADVLKYI